MPITDKHISTDKTTWYTFHEKDFHNLNEEEIKIGISMHYSLDMRELPLSTQNTTREQKHSVMLFRLFALRAIGISHM